MARLSMKLGDYKKALDQYNIELRGLMALVKKGLPMLRQIKYRKIICLKHLKSFDAADRIAQELWTESIQQKDKEMINKLKKIEYRF